MNSEGEDLKVLQATYKVWQHMELSSLDSYRKEGLD